jgi:hypothetical protein
VFVTEDVFALPATFASAANDSIAPPPLFSA